MQKQVINQIKRKCIYIYIYKNIKMKQINNNNNTNNNNIEYDNNKIVIQLKQCK